MRVLVLVPGVSARSETTAAARRSHTLPFWAAGDTARTHTNMLHHHHHHHHHHQHHIIIICIKAEDHISPALWIVAWLNAAAGFLVGYTDGPGAVFVPTVGEVLALDGRPGVFAAAARHASAPYFARLIDCRRVDPFVVLYIAVKPLAAGVAAAALALVPPRHLGRKDAVALGCVAMLASFFMQMGSTSWQVLFAGRALFGAGKGALMMVFVATAEVGRAAHRGRLAVSNGLGRALGLLSQGLILFGLQDAGLGRAAWHIKLAIGAWVTVLMLCILLLGGLVDSPASLAQRGRLPEARDWLQMLRPPLRAAEVSECGMGGGTRLCGQQPPGTRAQVLSRPPLRLALFLSRSRPSNHNSHPQCVLNPNVYNNMQQTEAEFQALVAECAAAAHERRHGGWRARRRRMPRWLVAQFIAVSTDLLVRWCAVIGAEGKGEGDRVQSCVYAGAWCVGLAWPLTGVGLVVRL